MQRRLKAWRRTITALGAGAVLASAPGARATGIPVIDIAAVMNLIQQIVYWQQQIAGMSNQLSQLQQTYSSMTGRRGMEGLLAMTDAQRNYLPADYSQVLATVKGASTTYTGLSSQIQIAMTANGVLSRAQLSGMTPEMRELVEGARKAAATASVMSQAAYQNTSQRFGALQQLINMIGAAPDPKAIQDLQARVGAEQAMLQNEQTKLQTLYQMAQADQWAQQQRVRERSINDIGSVNSLSNVPY